MFPSSDLFASGSNDGYIRFWHADLVERSIKEVGKIAASGFVNCLSFSPTGKYLVAGIGREHRLREMVTTANKEWRDRYQNAGFRFENVNIFATL